MTANLNHDYMWEIGFCKNPFLHFISISYISIMFGICFKTTSVYCFVILKKWDIEREREKDVKDKRLNCFLHVANSHGWSRLAGHPGRSDSSVKGSGAQQFPSPSLPPWRRGTWASYVFVRIKWDKGCEKPLSTIRLFQVQEIIIIIKVHFPSLAGLAGYCRNPSQCVLGREPCSAFIQLSGSPARALCGSGRGPGLPPASSLHPGPGPAASQQSLAVPWTFSVGSISSSGTTRCCANRARGRAKQRNMCAANQPPITGAPAPPGEGPVRAVIFHCSRNTP